MVFPHDGKNHENNSCVEFNFKDRKKTLRSFIWMTLLLIAPVSPNIRVALIL